MRRAAILLLAMVTVSFVGLAADAAWVFPTPSAATVKLGDKRWFTQIDALTRPRVEVRQDWWHGFRGLGSGGGRAAAPAAGGGVRVLSEQRLGALVVATLDATDATALSGWLVEHGYPLRPELAQAPQHVHLFAGPVVDVAGALGAFVGAGQWMTEFDATYNPENISSDWRFAYTADKAFRQVDVGYEPFLILGIPAGWLLVLLGIAAVLAGGITILAVRRRRRAVSR